MRVVGVDLDLLRLGAVVVVGGGGKMAQGRDEEEDLMRLHSSQSGSRVWTALEALLHRIDGVLK